ncbi:hypothetical protein V492_03936 [Pseudogymnoascus sp. VKM F-4246]|nr:hypothetical protein V492_03936 [Pseudogymnoascus sp. VKM F-4246]
MALQPRPLHRRGQPGTRARRDGKTDLGSGQRERVADTDLPRQRLDRNGGRDYGYGGRRATGLNLEPTNHCSENSEPPTAPTANYYQVHYQPVSQAVVVQLDRPGRAFPLCPAPRSISRSIPHINQSTGKAHARLPLDLLNLRADGPPPPTILDAVCPGLKCEVHAGQDRAVLCVYQHDHRLFGVLGYRLKSTGQNPETLFSVHDSPYSFPARPSVPATDHAHGKLSFSLRKPQDRRIVIEPGRDEHRRDPTTPTELSISPKSIIPTPYCAIPYGTASESTGQY